MSTSYYRLRLPVTYLSLFSNPVGAVIHDSLYVWINHALSGILTLYPEETGDVLRLFALVEDDTCCPLRTHWGGDERGAVVTVNDPTLPDDALVISSYAELLTVAQVKARDGARRRDGLPTELMGYE